jgi:hypothetical protein
LNPKLFLSGRMWKLVFGLALALLAAAMLYTALLLGQGW